MVRLDRSLCLAFPSTCNFLTYSRESQAEGLVADLVGMPDYSPIVSERVQSGFFAILLKFM